MRFIDSLIRDLGVWVELAGTYPEGGVIPGAAAFALFHAVTGICYQRQDEVDAV